MENRVAAVAATTSVSLDRSPPNAVRANDPPPPEWAVQKTEQADLRLIIEEDPDHGAYVYKTVDRRTGEVVSQIPRGNRVLSTVSPRARRAPPFGR